MKAFRSPHLRGLCLALPLILAGQPALAEKPKPPKVVSREVIVSHEYQFQMGPLRFNFRMPGVLEAQDLMDRARGAVGIVAILGLAYVLSENRREIARRVLFWGLTLQWAFALLVLRVPAGERVLRRAGSGVEEILGCALTGAEFVFGGKLTDPGGPAQFIFAFRVLPTVIFVAALVAVLYHLGLMQWIVRGFAFVMVRLMGASGAESLNVAASIFVGQTETPLTIRPYLPRMTNSELLTVMTAGMAHVSRGIMAAYFSFGVEPRHILTAVIMTAPGTILLAKMLVPETGKPKTLSSIRGDAMKHDANILDAASRGTRDGLQLALNIAAMVIASLGLIALINKGLGLAGTSLEALFGVALAPVAYLLGVPWVDCTPIFAARNSPTMRQL
jgi:concentrative nucleoside transporter, CNT family